MPSADMLTILGSMLAIGVAIAGLIVATQRSMRAEVGELHRDVQNLHNEVSGLRERMARLEGLLEGLREAITARQTAA